MKEAQELIAGIYGGVSAAREQGRIATAIILPAEHYRVLQAYRTSLGDLQNGLPDYLGKYDLFGIPLYTDGGTEVVIKTRRIEKT